MRASRVVFLASACMAMCYLLSGAVWAEAQPPQCVLQDNGLPPPANCHVVMVGPGGDTRFEDVDSDSRSGGAGNNPVVTVIPVGHTVQWQFEYTHSSTSGVCNAPLESICTANGQWDSTIKGTGSHTVTFNQPGVFTYFCGVHLTAMRGMVVVLNGPDYNLFATDPTFLSSAATPTLTIFAGDNGTFAGDLVSYLNFSSQLTLTCANGDPRNPSGCPTTLTTVTPNSGPFSATKSFTFPVSEAAGGDYFFDVVGDQQPLFTSPFSHRRRLFLRVNDLGLTPLTDPLTALRGPNLQTTVQAKSLGAFSGNVTNVTCNVTPAGGPNCAVSPTSFTLGSGAIQNLTVNLTNTATAEPTNYSVNLVAASNATNPGPGPFTRAKSFTLTLKAADRLVVTPTKSSEAPGVSLPVFVEAVDANGTLVNNYNRSVHFTSTDPAANLPADVPLVNGQGLLNVTFNSPGPRTVTVNDSTVLATFGVSPIIRVENTDVTDNSIALTSTRAPAKDAYFRNDDVTFIATVTAASGSPTGSVRFFRGAIDLGTAPLTGSGSMKTAELSFPHAAIGDYPITAVFEPEPASGFTANVSQPVLQRRFPSPRCVNDVCPGSH